MLPSIIINFAIVLINIACILFALTVMPAKKLFRYFTTLSNVLCALASLVTAIFALRGALPLWVVLFKYAGTAAVSVTLLTVFLFLGPVSGEWKKLLSGADFFFHLLCPLLAIVSFCFFEKTRFAFGWTALAVAPVVLYGAWYLYRVIYARPEKQWEDFYGFNRGGKWPVSVALMLLGACVVAVVLWLV